MDEKNLEKTYQQNYEPKTDEKKYDPGNYTANLNLGDASDVLNPEFIKTVKNLFNSKN